MLEQHHLALENYHSLSTTCPAPNIGLWRPGPEPSRAAHSNTSQHQPSESDAVPHSAVSCQATRKWASGCAYNLQPDHSLEQLVQEREKADALTDTAEKFMNRNLSVRTPSPPQALEIPEKLFRLIKVYFKDSCQKMAFDHNEILLSSDGAEFRNDRCTDFDSYCFTATMLTKKGMNRESGNVLSKAIALIEDILRAEHPRTLACFFEVLIHLIQSGHHQVAFMLRNFTEKLSTKIIRKESLWSQICRLLGELDPESLAHAMAQAWKCTIDVFDDVLGPSNRLAVSIHLDCIKRVITDRSEEERLLRHRVAQLADTPCHPTLRVMLNLAHNLNRQGRHDEAEEWARRVLSMLRDHEIYAGRNTERIESLKALSHSQCFRGNPEAARTMREAIQITVDHMGQEHPWVLEFFECLGGLASILGP